MSSTKTSRLELINTAATLFQEKGYRNTTMEDIADACSIKKASIYHHFPSRESLVVTAVQDCFASMKANYFSICFDTTLSYSEKSQNLRILLKTIFRVTMVAYSLAQLSKYTTIFRLLRKLSANTFKNGQTLFLISYQKNTRHQKQSNQLKTLLLKSKGLY